jgi:hypothetical protein
MKKSSFLLFILVGALLCGCALKRQPVAGVFTNLEMALQNPDQVLVLRLERQQLKTVPEQVQGFRNLKELHLKRNALTTLPLWLADLQQLERLSLGRNQFYGFPKEVLQVKQLKHLSLAGNKIAEIPENITELAQLETLDLFDTHVETLPTAALQQMPQLREIDLRQTFVFKEKIGPYQTALPKVKFLTMPGCDCNTQKGRLKKGK